MTAVGRPFTLARIPAVERRVGELVDALVSSLSEAAGPAWRGAALGGPHGHGEAGTSVDVRGAFVSPEPLFLLAVLEVPPPRAAALRAPLAAAAAATARSRRGTVRVRVVSADALALLPAEMELAECVGAGRVLDGPADLLGPAARLASAPLDGLEALRLLVRRGGALVAAERSLDRPAAGRGAVAAALAAVRGADLACGTALLVSAGRFVPGERARADALRALGASPSPAASFGVHARMTWTRFHDVVTRHRAAVSDAAAVTLPVPVADARQETGRAADRLLEVLRLLEEERLGEPLPTWTAYLSALARRAAGPRTRGLFEAFLPETRSEVPSPRALRSWPIAERIAPALATLLDWEPGDLAIAPPLLDLPADASREALRSRLAAWAATA